MNNYYVYEHIRNDTGECFYIGKGFKNRCKSKHGRNSYWQRIVNKAGFRHNIIASNLTEKEALRFEVVMIAAAKKAGAKLCNVTDGGEGVSGLKHSEKTRKLLREKCSMKNPEVVAKMAASKRGQKASEETKRKMSEAHKNISEETRARLVAGGKRNSEKMREWATNDNPRNVKVKYQGIVFNSVSALARFLNIPGRTMSHRIKNNPNKYGYTVL